MTQKAIAKTRAMAWIVPVLGLILSFQNCAPAANPSREFSSDQAANVPMSKVVVHLQHDSDLVLSDVELVADDVMRAIDKLDATRDSVSDSMPKLASRVLVTEAGASPSSFNLELPLGAEKIIVARAKVRDPISKVMLSYYGNAIVTLNGAVDHVTITMVEVP